MANKAQRLAPGRAGVISAALELFARDGISGVSLQQIADELSVTKAAVYHHFSTKAKIVRAVLQPGLEILGAAVETAGQRTEYREQQELIIRGLAECVAKNALSYQIMLSDPYATQILESDPELADLFRKMRFLLCGEKRDLQSKLAVSCFLSACLGPCGGEEFKSLSEQELCDVILDLGQRILLVSR